MTSMLSRLADRLTPPWMRVYYGPDSAARLIVKGGAYSWRCSLCGRRVRSAGFTTTLRKAELEAGLHARGHWFMRAVYEPDSED